MSGGSVGLYPCPQTKKGVNCATLTITTTLTRVVEENLELIKDGTILVVSVEEDDVEVCLGSEIIGYVDTPQKAQLIECISEGTSYGAKVTSKKDRQCKVIIKPTMLL